MMRRAKRIVLTLTAVGLLVAGLGLFVGSTAGAGSILPTSAHGSAVASATSNSFNFSNPKPVWDTGNLCVVQKSGAFWSCTYSGKPYYYSHDFTTAVTPSCSCYSPKSLIYNFSITSVTLNITLKDLSKRVAIFINIAGEYNTININVTGCKGGGTLNVSVLGEFDHVNFVNSAKGVTSSFTIYENHDGYTAQILGKRDKTVTTFVAAAPKYDLCPWRNASGSTDTFSVRISGYKDLQSLVWVNTVGYNSGPTWVPVGHWSFVTFENTTSFVCSWSFPPPSTCQHEAWWSPALIAASRD